MPDPTTTQGALRLPREVRFGYGSRQLTADLVRARGSRVLALVDPFLIDLPPVRDVLASVTARGCAVDECVDVQPELPVAGIAALAERARRADVVLAIGGGSVIDAAKLAAMVAVHGGTPADYYGEGIVPGPVMPVIALPTTAGTGSEVTPVAVVSDPDRAMKVGVSSPHLVPDVAVVDPEFTVGAPRGVTAFAGIDALVHALESFTAAPLEPDPGRVFTGRNVLAEGPALRAARLLATWLPVAVAEPADRRARENVALGSLLAGIAFGSTGTHLSHALQYPIGTLTKTPHGLGTGLMLPYVLDACLHDAQARGRLAEAAAALGSAATTEQDQARDVVRTVAAVAAAIGVPRTLADIGVRETDVPELVTHALAQQRLIGIAPIPVTEATLAGILQRALRGELSVPVAAT
ncbi:iron-containing alcohol dehydrogenase [Microbacterium sp.]|uniref:iron-containing alcohol dehydrogenase n=1 Tax=Microbacterium sp. TaxID=51671 RepID=UPI0037C8D2EE